jgi:hypothetical protein
MRLATRVEDMSTNPSPIMPLESGKLLTPAKNRPPARVCWDNQSTPQRQNLSSLYRLNRIEFTPSPGKRVNTREAHY